MRLTQELAGNIIITMTNIAYTESVNWETSIPLVNLWTVRPSEAFEAKGVPPERSGAAIVDEYADDLRRLADA